MKNQALTIGPRSGRWAEEYRCLSRERDPLMYAEGLLALGGRAETAGDLEFAARLYGVAANEGSPDSIRSRAQERLNAITGRGATGPRAEFLLRQLSREVLDPAPLTGMVAASAVFRMTRLAALAHSWRPLSANLLAFGAEAAMFPLGSRLAASALGRELDWNPALVGREIGSSFILLGAMRLAGEGARRAGEGVLRQQGAMLGGIMLAHQVETAIGLRPHLDGATTLIDSLALLLQFHVAGRLVHPWLGRGATDLESRSQLRPSEIFGLNPMPRLYRFPSLAWAGAGRSAHPPRLEGLRPAPTVLMMSGTRDGAGAREARILLHGVGKARRTSGVVEAAPDYRSALLELLERPGSRQHPALEGVLAELLKHDSALRGLIHRRLAAERDPALVEINSRQGEISKIFLFRGGPEALQPERLLFSYEVLRYNESLDTMLFELAWLPGRELVGNLYHPNFQGPPRLEPHYSGKRVAPQIVGPQRLRWTLFPKTSMELHVEREGGEEGAWEIRSPIQSLVLKLPTALP